MAQVFNKKTKLFNWGNFPKIDGKLYEPKNVKQVSQLVNDSDTLSVRGNGRCYGDANLNVNSLDTKRLNKFISFDRESGVIRCESGVLLSQILEVSVSAGFFLPVTPGTKFVSVGGALAADVHGKNHHLEGCFSDHVLSFMLLEENGEINKITKDDSLFWMTAGGMGLTGVILEVTFQLKPIESAFIKHEAIKAKNLDEIFSLFEESLDWTYTVAWIDCLQKGSNKGRSILFRGEHALRSELPEKRKKKPFFVEEKKKKSVPFDFPNFVLNTLSVKAFNFFYYNKQFKKHIRNVIDYDVFFYPLDSILMWNRIYGKKGFIQYQFVIPKKKGKEGMTEILEVIQNSGQGSFLAVLKLFGENNPKAVNSFPIEGYTLALDFKMTPTLPTLVKILDKKVEKYGGRIYRAKDSLSDPKLMDYLHLPVQTKFNSIQQDRLTRDK